MKKTQLSKREMKAVLGGQKPEEITLSAMQKPEEITLSAMQKPEEITLSGETGASKPK